MLTYPNFYPENLSRLEKITIFFIGITPIGYYLHPAWLSNFYAISSLLCIVSLTISKDKYPLTKEAKVVCLIFIAYPLAIFLSQFFRWEWQLKAYHDQSRFLLAIPIFLFLYKRKIDISNILLIAIPATLFAGLFSIDFLHSTSQWGDRRTVSFIDPLAFGTMNLTLGLICIPYIINTKWNRQNLFAIGWSCLGLSVGVYQSIYSQSRTGWLAGLIVPILLITIKFRFKWHITIFVVLSLFVLLISISLISSEIIYVRFIETINELISYPWIGGVAPDSTVSLRITFWRMGWFFFSESPFWGWGDKGFESLMESPEILRFASRFAINFAYDSLFHNELVSQSVRYGLLGSITTGYVFLVSLIFFHKHRFINNAFSLPAVTGLSLIICCFICGISNEIFNLKHLVSINAFLLACFLSATLVKIQGVK
jgi:O-antigen ligase